MIHRESQQSSIVEAFVNTSYYCNKTLTSIDEIINWKPIRNKIESLYRKSGPGRPAFPALVLFKALLLQQWYGLSDLTNMTKNYLDKVLIS